MIDTPASMGHRTEVKRRCRACGGDKSDDAEHTCDQSRYTGTAYQIEPEEMLLYDFLDNLLVKDPLADGCSDHASMFVHFTNKLKGRRLAPNSVLYHRTREYVK